MHYILTADGACRRDADHFDHSELFYDLGVINLAEITPTTIINKEITDSVGVAQFKKASNVVLTVHTSNGDFEVNCPQVSMGPIQKTFNSPSIVAGNEDSWNYLKIIANIQTDPSKVLISIQEDTLDSRVPYDAGIIELDLVSQGETTSKQETLLPSNKNYFKFIEILE